MCKAKFFHAGTFEYMSVNTIKFSEQSALQWDGHPLGLFRPFLRKCPDDRKALMEAGALYRVRGGGGWGGSKFICLILNRDEIDVYFVFFCTV